MKYYSDVTKKFYNDVKVLEADEAAVVKAEEERKAALVKQQEQQTKLKEQRAARAEEITQAIKERDEAQKKVNELLNKFIKDYCYCQLRFLGEEAEAQSTRGAFPKLPQG